jgi:hypothetical protein
MIKKSNLELWTGGPDLFGLAGQPNFIWNKKTKKRPRIESGLAKSGTLDAIIRQK